MPNKKALPVVMYTNIKHNIGNGKPTILTFGMSHCYSCLAMSKVFARSATFFVFVLFPCRNVSESFIGILIILYDGPFVSSVRDY